MSKTILIVAGETSGDLHGANLAIELKRQTPDIRLIGAGGDKMRAAGVELVSDSTKFASVGFVEAMGNFNKYACLYRLLISALRTEKPDLCVLIDFPDFNLRFGERVRESGIPIVYYISPQVWAWRKGRVQQIARMVKKMLVIFEFEKRIYEDAGVDVEFVGHPLMDVLAEPTKFDGLKQRTDKKANEITIGILPGSRVKEVKRLFPLMLETAGFIRRELPNTQFLVGVAPDINPDLVNRVNSKFPSINAKLFYDRTYEVMRAADLLLIASGTATVEAAILGTPMIVTYKVNQFTGLLGLLLIKSKDLAMVNIIARKRIMPEYYQWYAKPDAMAKEAISIIRDGRLEGMKKELEEIRAKLGSSGASRRVAEAILKLLR